MEPLKLTHRTFDGERNNDEDAAAGRWDRRLKIEGERQLNFPHLLAGDNDDARRRLDGDQAAAAGASEASRNILVGVETRLGTVG